MNGNIVRIETIGDATLYLADCMEYMATLPDKAFDLAIVDPPYGIGDFKNSVGARKPFNKGWKITWNKEPPNAEYFNEIYRVSVNQIIWGSNYYIGNIRHIGAIVWDKGNSSAIGSDCEIASQSFDQRVVKHYLQNIGFIGPEKGQKIHPCQKPVKLYEWLLTNYAKPGDRILDTHLGSMSSVIACLNMGFAVTGCELDPDYFAAGVERVQNSQRQETLFEPARAKQEQLTLDKG